jgi:hypothetical protein
MLLLELLELELLELELLELELLLTLLLELLPALLLELLPGLTPGLLLAAPGAELTAGLAVPRQGPLIINGTGGEDG